MSSLLYRSPGLIPGHFRRLGCLHVHVDGDLSLPRLTALVQTMEARGHPGKVTSVSDFVGGTQRAALPETYASHTPGPESEERFEYFSTISLADRSTALAVLKDLLPIINACAGSVIEVEQVVATSDAGEFQTITAASIAPIESWEVGFQVNRSAPYEVHHGINVEVERASTMTVRVLEKDLTLEGLSVGGWFTFNKTNQTSYRSSAFLTGEDFELEVRRQRELLKRYLCKRFPSFELWTTVERVIAIWKAPLREISV
jgi:hypothetical protein